jgi:sec-independent protein translocase protein TatB
MFDIGWSEFVVIAVVALIAIGPKELPGVLRMVGQWMGKARRMASEFQGQFQEAMREAEMADLKKSFDEVKEAATGFRGGNIMTSLQKDVGEALRIDDIDKPAASVETPATPHLEASSQPEVPATSLETSSEIVPAETHLPAVTQEHLPTVTHEIEPQPVPQDTQPAAAEVDPPRDAKAS